MRKMAELTIRPDEIRDALARFVEEYEPGGVEREEVGTVVECGDGIARVEGLPSAMANELLEFENGIRGIALNLDVREIGVVILGEFSGIEEGQRVRRTGEVLSVPVGDSFLGRVVSPLGDPLDGLGSIEDTELRPLEVQAPSVVQRQPVKEPLQTGIKAIDAMTPIGRGQRQLIIGDRQTGKTAIAIDTIINQRANWESGDPARQVRCIYVAVGQKGSTIASVRQSLEDAGAMAYTTIVAAPASDPAGYKYIAPYTGSAIGQHWMYQGKHVLIIFDDLTKQAEAYRAISLLLRYRPVRLRLLGQVVEDDQHVLALVHPMLADRRPGVRGNVLVARRVRCGRGHDRRIGHRACILQRLADRRDRGTLLPDSDIDAAHLACGVARFPVRPLVDDRVDGDRRLARLPVADDQLALAAADRRHCVDCLDAGLQWLLHGLALHDARRLQLKC